MKRWIILFFLAPLNLTAGTFPAHTFYHAKEFGLWSCNDKKILAEIRNIEHYNVNDPYIARLAHEGQCFPTSNEVKLDVLRFESFSVPAGIQKVAFVQSKTRMCNTCLYQTNKFYMMQSDIEPFHKTHEK